MKHLIRFAVGAAIPLGFALFIIALNAKDDEFEVALIIFTIGGALAALVTVGCYWIGRTLLSGKTWRRIKF